MPKTELRAKSVSINRNVIGKKDGFGSSSVVANQASVLPSGTEGQTLRYEVDTNSWEANSQILVNNGLTTSVDVTSDAVNLTGLAVTVDGEIDLYNSSHSDRGIHIKSTNGGFAEIPVDTTNFDKNLSSADDTVQKCLETLDELETGGGSSELVNVELLSANKTLVAADKSVQIYDTNNVNRTVYFPTTGLSEGKKFTIRNNDGSNSSKYINLYTTTTVQTLYAGQVATYIWSGTKWMAYDLNAIDTSVTSYYNVGLGSNAVSYGTGTAVGGFSIANTNGAAFAYSSDGHDNGSGFGAYANGSHYGSANGAVANGSYYGSANGYYANTNSKYYSSALNAYAKCQRINELALTYTGGVTNYSNFLIIGIKEQNFTGAAGFEVFLDGSSTRLVLVNNSILNFTSYITAVDTANGEAHYWKHKGLIKNIGGTVTMLSVTVEEENYDAGMSLAGMALTADDTNNSLHIGFTCLAGKTIRVGGHFRLHDLRY